MADPYQYEINHMEKTQLIGDAFELACAAEAASSREHWAILSARFDEQMEEWREIGSGDGARTRWKDNDEDDALWEEFSSHRDEFRELRDAWFEGERARRKQELGPAHQQAAATKRALIDKLRGLGDAEPFEADKAAEQLFAEWKKVGHAGDHEAALWSAFNTSRRSIKDKKKAIIEGRKAKLDGAVARKREIIKEAAHLCACSEWDVVARRHNELRQAWKAAGGTGKLEATLWDEFKSWLDKSKQRRIAIQRGDADPFPPPVIEAIPATIVASAAANVDELSRVEAPPPPNEAKLDEEAPAVISRPRRRPVFFMRLAIVAALAGAYARPLEETPPPRKKVAALADVVAQTPAGETTKTLSCLDYQAARAARGGMYEVGCNSRTSPGYYWAVQKPRLRPYGYWGMRGVGATPACRSTGDIGRQAETAVFKTASAVWDVRAYWCRQSQQHTDCHGRRDEGPVFTPGTDAEGVFAVVCLKQQP